ncbi:hypothetical protein BC827DRAFT_97408 [Russula dissimulans]|nr:hypothetical protein BC827DRAFT_97408 [Russula dissimulans]
MARHADPETVASLLAQNADNKDAVHDTSAPHHLDRRTLDPSPMVQRIPSTSLSFFPPPSSRPSTPPPQARLTSMPSTSHPFPRSYSSATISTPSRGPSLRSNALSSFFSILPINASTRDEIISRLSMDSVSNSTTASDEADHELTAVPSTSKHFASASGTSFADSLVATNSQRQRKRPTRTWPAESSKPNGYQEPYLRDVEQIALASTPIHTTQMQPAAAMQLPESMTRSPPKGPPPPNDPHNGARRPSGGDHRRIR